MQQKRLRHITEFISSSAPDETMKKQTLEKIAQIEGPEPMELYGEDIAGGEQSVSKAMRTKATQKVATKKKPGKKRK